MDWLEVKIDTNFQGLEPVQTLLSALDVERVIVEDET